MSKEHWAEASQKALDLFIFGMKESNKNGLILVDTKYEMGLNQNDEIIVLDEMHTPDSSRYWLQETYQERGEWSRTSEYMNFSGSGSSKIATHTLMNSYPKHPVN